MAIRLGVIGGRETYELLRQGLVRSERRYAINTPFGQAGTVFRVTAGGSSYYFLPRQGEEDAQLPPSAINYRANVYALKELGVQAILAWSGPAALVPDLPAGRFVLPDDLIDLTHRRDETFFERSRAGLVRQWPVFCPTLRRAGEQALTALGLEATAGGTYVCTEGPRLDTPAEARLFANWGGTLVGMTLCPEVFLARELGMCYAALCYVTGCAEGLVVRYSSMEGCHPQGRTPAADGLGGADTSHPQAPPTASGPLEGGTLIPHFTSDRAPGEREYVSGSIYRGLAAPADLAAVETAVRRFPEVLQALLEALADAPEDDPCRQTLARSREPGLGDDWHAWLSP